MSVHSETTSSLPSTTASSADGKPTSKRIAYSLAAGAAAASLAGEAQAASSISVTDADIVVGQGTATLLDINADGQNDILLSNYINIGGNYQGASVQFFPGQLVGFTDMGTSLSYGTALSAGDLIDSSTVGPTFFGSLAYGANNPNAQFNDVETAFIGFSFPAGPDTFFAYVEVAIDNDAGEFFIDSFAFNTIPGEAILAGQVPEPGTLGLLAAGSLGLGALRRRR